MKVQNEDKYPEKIADLQEALERRRTIGEGYLEPMHKEMRIDADMYNNKQWDPRDEAARKEGPRPRPTITFNRVAPLVDAIYGAMIHNQYGTGFAPRRITLSTDGPQIDEVVTGANSYFRSAPEWNAEAVDRETFIEGAGLGLGVQQMVTDVDEDGETIFRAERINPFTVYWDPRAQAPGLTDARWILRIARIDADEFEDLFGEKPEGNPDEKGAHEAAPAIGDRAKGVTEADDPYEVEHHQWYRMEDFKVVRYIDQNTGEEVTANLSKDGIRELESAGYVEGVGFWVMKGGRRRRYWEAFVYEKKVRKIQRIDVNMFTYLFFTGKRDAVTGAYYGVIRNARDPQRWANTFFSLFTEILAFSGKGYIYEEGVFLNETEAQTEWARPDSLTKVADGSLMNNRIQPKQGQALPPGSFDLAQLAIAGVPATLGIPLEQLGMNDIQQAGVTEESRKRAAMGVVGWLFGSWRNFMMRSGQLSLRFLIEYIDEGTLIRTSAVDPTVYQQFTLPRGVKYDVVVDQVPDSPNKRAEVQQALNALVTIAPVIPQQVPPNFFETVVKVSGLPSEMVRRMYAEARQPNPAAERAQQLQEAAATAKIQKDQASAEKDHAAAKLDMARTAEIAHEIQGSDINLLHRAREAQIKQAHTREMGDTRVALARGMARIRLSEKAVMTELAERQQRQQIEHQREQIALRQENSSSDD